MYSTGTPCMNVKCFESSKLRVGWMVSIRKENPSETASTCVHVCTYILTFMYYHHYNLVYHIYLK